MGAPESFKPIKAFSKPMTRGQEIAFISVQSEFLLIFIELMSYKKRGRNEHLESRKGDRRLE